jgi:hypothetical protein
MMKIKNAFAKRLFNKMEFYSNFHHSNLIFHH